MQFLPILLYLHLARLFSPYCDRSRAERVGGKEEKGRNGEKKGRRRRGGGGEEKGRRRREEVWRETLN